MSKSNLSVLNTSSLATVRSCRHPADRTPSRTPWVWLFIQSMCASVHWSLYHSRMLFSLLQLDCCKGNYSWKCGCGWYWDNGGAGCWVIVVLMVLIVMVLMVLLMVLG